MTDIPEVSDTDCSDNQMYKYSDSRNRNSVHSDTEHTDPDTVAGFPPAARCPSLSRAVHCMQSEKYRKPPVYFHNLRPNSPAAVRHSEDRILSRLGSPNNNLHNSFFIPRSHCSYYTIAVLNLSYH